MIDGERQLRCDEAIRAERERSFTIQERFHLSYATRRYGMQKFLHSPKQFFFWCALIFAASCLLNLLFPRYALFPQEWEANFLLMVVAFYAFVYKKMRRP